MAMAKREPDQADFDLDRFIDLFDQAMTSQDPRVVDALRSLMMMVILTKPEAPLHERTGPLRRLFEEQRDLARKIGQVQEEIRQIHRNTIEKDYGSATVEKYFTKYQATEMAEEFDDQTFKKLIKSHPPEGLY